MDKKYLPLPEGGLIPIPPMTRMWGQIPCYLEFLPKRGWITQVILGVPVFENSKPHMVEYKFESNFNRFHTDTASRPGMKNFSILYCRDHKIPSYEFNFPVGARFIACRDIYSSIYASFDFILASWDELNAEEKKVLKYYPELTNYILNKLVNV